MCILVLPSLHDDESRSKYLTDRIVSVATNRPLFKENESDIHAEIVAISKRANRTNYAYAYITMPPCKRCFAALLESGITKIVSRYPSTEAITAVARDREIEMVIVPENRRRINDIIQRYNDISCNVNDEDNLVQMAYLKMHSLT